MNGSRFRSLSVLLLAGGLIACAGRGEPREASGPGPGEELGLVYVGPDDRGPDNWEPFDPGPPPDRSPDIAPPPTTWTDPQLDDDLDLRQLDPVAAAQLSDGMKDGPAPATPRRTTPPGPAGRAPVTDHRAESVADAAPATQVAADAEPWIRRVERAQGLSRWRRQSALAADLAIESQGSKSLFGRLVLDTEGHRVRLEHRRGTTAVLHGDQVSVWPASSPWPDAGNHMETWSTLLATPFTLRAPGAHVTYVGETDMLGHALPTLQRTDERGQVDLIRIDRQTGWVRSVTRASGRGLATGDFQTVIFDDYANVEGVILPRRWTLWNRPSVVDRGAPPEGRVQFIGLGFVTPTAESFSPSTR